MTKTDIYIDRKISKNISVEKSEQSSDKSETGSDIYSAQSVDFHIWKNISKALSLQEESI